MGPILPEEDLAEDEVEQPGSSGEPAFDDFPAPPTRRAGRVLGGGSSKGEKTSSLPEYKRTVIIGPDGLKEVPTGGEPVPPASVSTAPVAPGLPGDNEEEGDHPDPLDQTMVANQQYQPPPSQQARQEILEEAQAEAQQIMAQAQQMMEQAQMQAQQIVNDAMAQAQQAAEEARRQAAEQGYQEGREAGLAEGRQAGEVQHQQMIEHLKFQFVEMMRLRRKIVLDMEPEIIRLSIEIAKRVVGDEIEKNREIIVGVVRSALATLGERDEILIRVNPAEFESVKPHQQALEAMIEGLKKFVIQPDGAIELGSCAIETNLGNVDARIETQFEAIRLGLEEMTKIRQFERGEQVDALPVEVPGDPDFEQRMKERQHAELSQEGSHGSQEEAPEDQGADDRYQQQPGEMELLPEPTEELFAQLTPEQQQEYLEAYHQQQAYLEHLQNQMAQEQEQQMELLPEPTEEFFAQLTPEQQQEYMEAYQQQQAYLQQMQGG